MLIASHLSQGARRCRYMRQARIFIMSAPACHIPDGIVFRQPRPTPEDTNHRPSSAANGIAYPPSASC